MNRCPANAGKPFGSARCRNGPANPPSLPSPQTSLSQQSRQTRPHTLRNIRRLIARRQWNKATTAAFAAQGKTEQTFWWL